MRDQEIDYKNGNILKKSFEIVPVQPLPPGTGKLIAKVMGEKSIY